MKTSIQLATLSLSVALASCSTLSSPATDTQATHQEAAHGLDMKRSFVDGPFGQVHLRSWYPATGENLKAPIILFHPTPHSGDVFVAYAEFMAKDRVVVAIDTPGFGDSTAIDHLPSIEEYADSADAVLRELGYGEDGMPSQIDVLGSHTGALIATEVAVRHPELVRRVILSGVPYFVGEDRTAAYERNVTPYVLKQDGSHVSDRWKYYSRAIEAGVPLERVQEHYSDAMQSYPNSWQGYHAAFTYESEKRIPNMRQCALLLSTSGSLLEETKASLNVYPNASFIHFDGYPASVFDLGPGHLAEVTKDFLDQECPR